MAGRVRVTLIAAIALVSLAAIARAKADPAAAADVSSMDTAEGDRLAHMLCINCHVVDSRGPLVRTDRVPSLSWIAHQPGLTREHVSSWLSTSHARMPDYTLTRDEVRQLTAYIFSLRTKQ